LKVQVTRPGLMVRYPKGYFALKDEPATQNERQESFLAAIRSPLDSTAIPLLVKAVRVDQPADTIQIAGSIGLSISPPQRYALLTFRSGHGRTAISVSIRCRIAARARNVLH
jgi:hypothetical protein